MRENEACKLKREPNANAKTGILVQIKVIYLKFSNNQGHIFERVQRKLNIEHEILIPNTNSNIINIAIHK